MRYKISEKLENEMFDSVGNLMPHKVLGLFQRLATEHAENLGLGFESMLKKNLLWVVTQVRYEVCGKITPETKVILETWPLPPNRLGFERCYRITDNNGNLLIKGSSNWVIIDTKERKMVASEDIYPRGDYYEAKIFEERARRLRDFEAEDTKYSVTPDEIYIDNNGHVNNTYYALFAEKALKGLKGEIASFQIDFIHEVLKGEQLNLYCLSDEEKSLVKGVSQNGDRMFACVINYK